MRISPVIGDLPAVATLTEPAAPPPPHHEQAPPAVAPVASATGGNGADLSDHQRRESRPQAFDPPLIAQRAVLGLPVGTLIAELAEAEQVTYIAAKAAVDRAMPQD